MAEDKEEEEEIYCILEIPKLAAFSLNIPNLMITDFTQEDAESVEATIGDIRITGKKRKVLGTYAVVKNEDISADNMVLTTEVVTLDEFSIAPDKLDILEKDEKKKARSRRSVSAAKKALENKVDASSKE